MIDRKCTRYCKIIFTFALERHTGHVTSARESNGEGTIDGNLKGNTSSNNKAKTVCAITSNGLEGVAAVRRWRSPIGSAICDETRARTEAR